MTGISVKYTELLSVAIELPYYLNKQSRKGDIDSTPDIAIMPDAATLELFKRMDLIIREIPGGVIVLAQVKGQTTAGNDIMRFPAREGDRITLLMRLNNRDVLNVNELPTAANAGKLFYLSNTVDDDAAGRDNLHLGKDAAGISAANDLVSFARDNYRIHLAETVDPATAAVRHQLTGISIAPVSCINIAAEADLQFTLASMPSGMCDLWIGGTKRDTFYHLADNGIQAVFGVIELSLNAVPGLHYGLIEPDRSLLADKPKYIARFKSRETIWRYTFHLQPNSPLFLERSTWNAAQKAALKIITNDPSITFTADPSGTDTDLVFITSSSHALQEAYFISPSGLALSMTLTKFVGDPQEAPVKRGLPYPPASMINATALPAIYSDIFITI